ncbi:hypothetical protein [Solicola gregarius]|uniref:Uncharacterized protein n=1 Tax=Solicola gregarius TaxID=2908642 RepID=A0AA46TGM4_9ACTN|nr:hypothetical protein [Solicola gregarius]UYM05004.1 hypothetical protein L0C25_21170 [Solicola gregarius]
MDRPTESRGGRMSRRGVLMGIALGATAPVASALTGGPAMAHPRASAARRTTSNRAPECLSGLIQEGRMTYADLMAG